MLQTMLEVLPASGVQRAEDCFGQCLKNTDSVKSTISCFLSPQDSIYGSVNAI